MSRRALLVCPGRGSYGRDSLGYLKDRSPAASAVITACDEARAALGRPTVSEIDAASDFRTSWHVAGEHASLLGFACAMADAAEIAAERFQVVGVTGNSMGFYTALVLSGALELGDGIRLVETMAAYQEKNVIGGQVLYPVTQEDWSPDSDLQAAVDAALALPGVYLSIRLGGHVVLGADDAGLAALQTALPSQTRGARTFPLRLPRHSAFHTPLLEPTSQRARWDLADLLFRVPRVPLIDGRGHVFAPRWADPEAMRTYTLGHQVTRPYDFDAALITALHHCAPDVVVLLGPGNSLGGPSARLLVRDHWRGIVDRAGLDGLEEPILLSCADEAHRAVLR